MPKPKRKPEAADMQTGPFKMTNDGLYFTITMVVGTYEAEKFVEIMLQAGHATKNDAWANRLFAMATFAKSHHP